MSFLNLNSLINLELKKNPETPLINQSKEVVKDLGPKNTYMTWHAPDREEFSINNKTLFRTFIVITAFFIVLFISMEEYALIMLIASIVFVFYALKKAPIKKIEHEINSHGITYAGQEFNWDKLESFYFKNDNLVCVDTYLSYPRRLFIIIEPDKKKEITENFKKHIKLIEEPPKTYLDKIYDFLYLNLKK